MAWRITRQAIFIGSPHWLLFLFVSRFRKNKGRIVLVLRLSALPPRVIPPSLSSSHLRSQKD